MGGLGNLLLMIICSGCILTLRSTNAFVVVTQSPQYHHATATCSSSGGASTFPSNLQFMMVPSQQEAARRWRNRPGRSTALGMVAEAEAEAVAQSTPGDENNNNNMNDSDENEAAGVLDAPEGVAPDSPEELMYTLGVNLARQLGDVRPLVEDGRELAQVAKGLLDTVIGRLSEEGQRQLLQRRGAELNQVITDRA